MATFQTYAITKGRKSSKLALYWGPDLESAKRRLATLQADATAGDTFKGAGIEVWCGDRFETVTPYIPFTEAN